MDKGDNCKEYIEDRYRKIGMHFFSFRHVENKTFWFFVLYRTNAVES